MHLLLLAVDPDRDGRPRFTPALAPTLVLADLLDKTRRGRPAPDSMADYLRTRAPGRLERYVEAARELGILEVSVRREGYFGHTRIRVADRWPLERAVDRLVRILNSDQHPDDRDLAFVVLAEQMGRAQVHLKGRKHRDPRRRLELLVGWVGSGRGRHRSVANAVLYDGLRAIPSTTVDLEASFAALR
ncbi:hypothetical protein ABH935_001935 [Catenulispora sp. GAS73]|uniref:GPP34 family phosphoprotein n=1 Tax=Catenulispora sp. GAS73 TaxID=3156269 RepID=UPI0035182595